MQNSDWINANNLVKARQWAEALEAFDRGYELLADHPDFVHDRAVCLFQVGRKKEALSELNRAVDLQPDYSYRYASRAYIRNAMKDILGAIDDYKKALELDPEDAISLNNLGMLEEQLGYRKEADERYRMADELNQILTERGILPQAPPQEERTQSTPEPSEAASNKPLSDQSTVANEIRKVFASRQSFREFVRFISNGLKLGASKTEKRDKLS